MTEEKISILVRGLSLKDREMKLRFDAKKQYQKHVSRKIKLIIQLLFFLPAIVIIGLIFSKELGLSKIPYTIESSIIYFLFGINIGILLYSMACKAAANCLYKNFYADNPEAQNGYQLILDKTQLQMESDRNITIVNYNQISECTKLTDEIWLINFRNQTFTWIYINELGDEETTKQVKQWFGIA